MWARTLHDQSSIYFLITRGKHLTIHLVGPNSSPPWLRPFPKIKRISLDELSLAMTQEICHLNSKRPLNGIQKFPDLIDRVVKNKEGIILKACELYFAQQ